MAKKMNIKTPGLYRTIAGGEVMITRIAKDRAYGYALETPTNTTWWYAGTGEHAVYTPDDLVAMIIDHGRATK